MIKKVLFISVVFLFLAMTVFFGMTDKPLVDVPAQLEQAQVYVDNSEYEQAEAIYKTIITDYPGSDYVLEAQNELIALYIDWGKRAEAEEVFEQVFAEFSLEASTPEAVIQMADIYSELGKPEKTCELFRYVIENWPESENAMWSLVSVAISEIGLGDDLNAEAAVEQLVTNFSDNNDIAGALNEIADKYFASQKYEKAGELFQYVIDNRPQSEQAMWSQMGLALSNIALRDDPNAEAAIENLLGDFSGNEHIAGALYQIANRYRELHKYDKAVELYQYVTENYPQSDKAILSQRFIVISNIRSGDESSAQSALDKLLADFAKHVDLASAVLDNNDIAEALNDIAGALNDIADIYREFQKYEEANQLYQYVLQSWPETEGAMLSQAGLAKLNIALGNDANAQGAIEILLTEFAENKNIAGTLNDIADSYHESQKYEKARQLYQYVIDNWPDSEVVIHCQADLALSNIALGDDPNAQAAIDGLIADFGDHPDLPGEIYRIASYECWDVKRYEDARRLYKYIVDNLPESEYVILSRGGVITADIGLGNDANAVLASVDSLIANFNEHPSLPRAIFMIADQYYINAWQAKKEGDETAAAENFRKTIAVRERIIELMEPSAKYTPKAYFTAGVCYAQELGEYLRGIEYFEEAAGNWPEYAHASVAQYQVGRYYEKAGQAGELDEDEAQAKMETAYQALVENYPKSEEAAYTCLKLGRLNYNREYWLEAAMYFELFREKKPEELRRVVLPMGEAFEKMGEADEAVRVYRQFLETSDQNDRLAKQVKERLEDLEGENK